MQPLPKGDRVAIITNAGGPGIMAADAVEHAGMQVAALNPEVAAELAREAACRGQRGQPHRRPRRRRPRRYAMAVEAAQGDPGVDAVISHPHPPGHDQAGRDGAGDRRESSNGEKPVLAAFMGGGDIMPGRDELVAANLPDYPSPERAVAALKAMVDYAAWRLRPPRVVARFPVNRRRVERIISRQLRTGRTYLGEVKAKDILRAYDFIVPDGRLVSTVDEATEAAPRLGYPLAMKIVSPDIIHKSDMGGVKLNLSSAQEVADAFELMMLRVGRKAPDAFLEGVYLERMVPKGREVILGMTRDPQFGPMLMFGLGGIFVEVMKDVTFHLAPITSGEAMSMLMGTRSYRLLEGLRGEAGREPRRHRRGAATHQPVVTDFPQIAELDINPFIVGRWERNRWRQTHESSWPTGGVP